VAGHYEIGEVVRRYERFYLETAGLA